MAADINIIEFNYSFLKSLDRDTNLSTSNIKFKFTDYLRPKTQTQQFSTIENIPKIYPDIKLSKNDRKCMYGDFSKIEEVLITNNNLPFYNEFRVYNISGDIRIVDKVQFNGLNKDFYTQEIQRFKKFLVYTFERYTSGWNSYKSEMDKCYVASCYVDKYYNCPDNDVAGSGTNIVYPDISLSAGPDQIISFDTITQPLFSVIGATHVAYGGAVLKWSINTSDISIVDDSNLLPSCNLSNLTLSVGTHNYVMTLTVTYPWGPAIADTKNITITRLLSS